MPNACTLNGCAASSKFSPLQVLSRQTVHEGCSRQKLDLARFVSLRACASFNVSEHSTAHALHVDLVAPATVFRATPVALVPVVPSALTKHLASPPVDTEATPKSG